MSQILKGATDVTRYVLLVDSVTGEPETGYTIANLDLQYTRNRTAPAAKVDATALAATDTAHTDNRAIQVDATSSPGLYRVDWPDAAFASGVDKVLLVVSGSGIHPAIEEIELIDPIYTAKAWMADDNAGTNDRYVVAWYKDGVLITTGITSPTIQVIKAADGADLVASAAMTEIGTTKTFRYNEATNRIASGAVYMVKMEATIDGAARTWMQPISRDG